MNKLYLLLFGFLLTAVTIPSSAKKQYNDFDMQQRSIYDAGDLYLTDGDSNTIKISAPNALADDDTNFTLPNSNGSANQMLEVDGAGNTSWSFIFDNNIDASAAIARSKVANGTANYVMINSGTGAMSEEQYLAESRGGFGIDASTLPADGILKRVGSAFSLSPANVEDSNNVVVSALSDGQVLKYSASNDRWENGADNQTVLDSDVVTKTADYTITDVDGVRTVLVDMSGVDITIDLPTVADNDERRLTIKLIGNVDDANTLFIDPESTELIDADSNSFEIRQVTDSLTVVSDGSEWYIEDFLTSEVVKESSGTDYLASTLNTFARLGDASNNTITIPRGRWEVSYQCVFWLEDLTAFSGTSATAYGGKVSLTTDTTGPYTESHAAEFTVGTALVLGAGMRANLQVTRSAILEIADATTFTMIGLYNQGAMDQLSLKGTESETVIMARRLK